MTDIPADAVGGDLIWWRESPSCHTAVTLWGEVDALHPSELDGVSEIGLLFRLHDRSGALRTTWTATIGMGRLVSIDSKDYPGIPQEGVLAIFATNGRGRAGNYRRLLSMVDWYSEAGDLVSLHSDHSVSSRFKPIEYTEVVFLETAEARNSLVLVNGPEAQDAASVVLEIRNHRGETRRAAYHPPMDPFSLHKLSLGELFPELSAFCDGRHATLEGRFDARSVFSRPYVMTEGPRLAGYHGGDRYHWGGLPRFVYKALGRGEVNPMVAIRSDALTTIVNLLNSHGDLEDDFWVDARLYDQRGVEVAQRKRWLLARRGGLSRGDIAELLADNRAFIGHVALSFSDDDKPFYPRRLQALLEYRTSVSTARVMAWSDIWNARPSVRAVRDKLAGVFDVSTLYGEDYFGDPDVTYRCHYRVWRRPPMVSYIAVTNCGAREPYEDTISYVLRLYNARGEYLTLERTLAAHATAYDPIDALFPSAESFLRPSGIGVAVVESRADLAVMHLSHHQVSGVFSAEHFLPSVNYHNGQTYACCGS
jgi:hypothetical protein